MPLLKDRGHALPWRYGLFLAGLVCAVPLGMLVAPVRAMMLGFDIGAVLFMASLAPLFSHDASRIRDHVRENDANRTLILILSAIVSLVILAAVGIELGARAAPGGATTALVLVTLALAWLFSNAVYTVHYAFLFYSQPAQEGHGKADRGGLEIPGVNEPDYWDFAYFAFTLGMTFQTSDVAITGRAIRKAALAHSLAAFVFNLGIIAYTINILGG
jgi:uncharacterized membrane protein